MTKWWHGWTKCEICGAVEMAVIEIEGDQDEPVVNMECGECGNFSCHPTESREEEEDDD